MVAFDDTLKVLGAIDQLKSSLPRPNTSISLEPKGSECISKIRSDHFDIRAKGNLLLSIGLGGHSGVGSTLNDHPQGTNCNRVLRVHV